MTRLDDLFKLTKAFSERCDLTKLNTESDGGINYEFSELVIDAKNIDVNCMINSSGEYIVPM